jgi:hypothetical protein
VEPVPFPIALRNSIIITGALVLNIISAPSPPFPCHQRRTFFKVSCYLFIVGLMLPFER